MNNLPSAYDSLIENPEDRLSNIMDPLTINIPGDKLSKKYAEIRKRKGFKSNKSDNSEEDNEGVMFTKTCKGRDCKFGKFGTRLLPGGLMVDRMIKGTMREVLNWLQKISKPMSLLWKV